MKRKFLSLLVLLCAVVTGAWAEDYYLAGSMNGWSAEVNGYKLTVNPENSSELMITLDLAAGAEFKVVGVEGDDPWNWYPDQGENYYVEDAGKYTIYFRPDGQGGTGWHYGYIYVEPYVEPVTPVIPDGTYYVMAPALGQMFMAAGQSWGTQGIVNEVGLDLTFTFNESNGTYDIETGVFNDANKHFLGSGLFMDATSYGWKIEEGDYLYTISGVIDGVKKYIAADSYTQKLFLTEDGTADEAQWAFLPKAYWESEARIMEEEPSQTNPVNVTCLIKGANFNRNDQRNDAWTWETTNHDVSGDNTNFCAESYHAPFVLSQTITGIPAGVYALTAQGFYNGSDGYNKPYIYANTERSYFPTRTGNEQSMSAASQAFSAGNYNFEYPVFVEVTESGELTVGAKLENSSSSWCIWDNFQLSYYGKNADINALKAAAFANLYTEVNSVKDDALTLYAQLDDEEALGILDAALPSATTEGKDAASLQDVIDALNYAMVLAAQVAEKNKYNPVEGTCYVIDMATGKFMAAGHDWGTHGIVNDLGLDLTFIPNTTNNRVTIETRVKNGDTDHFLGSNLYMDGAAYEWGVEAQDFGCYISSLDGKYISVDENDDLVLSDTPYLWYIATAESVNAARIADLADATVADPLDATFLLQNPNFNRNDQRVSAWVFGPDANANHNFNGGNNVNNCAESWHAAFTAMQTVSGVPAGFYSLTAQGFYREDGAAPEDVLTAFFANGVNADLLPMGTLESYGYDSDLANASANFADGKYAIEPIFFEVTADGMMYVGVTNNVTNRWVAWDNFQLTYYGTENPVLRLSEVDDNAEVLADKDNKFVALVEVDRQLTKGVWNTFAVPFAMTKAELGEGVLVKQLDSSELNAQKVLTMNFVEAEKIEAGVPYLVKPVEDIPAISLAKVYISGAAVPTVTDAVDFIPTLGKTTVTADPATIRVIGTDNKLHMPAAVGDMKGFRAYLQLKGEAVNARTFFLDLGDEATGITVIEKATTDNDAIYNLNGQRVNGTQRGVYVVNGKKVIIK